MAEGRRSTTVLCEGNAQQALLLGRYSKCIAPFDLLHSPINCYYGPFCRFRNRFCEVKHSKGQRVKTVQLGEEPRALGPVPRLFLVCCRVRTEGDVSTFPPPPGPVHFPLSRETCELVSSLGACPLIKLTSQRAKVAQLFFSSCWIGPAIQ